MRKLYPLDQTKVMGWQASLDAAKIENKSISTSVDVPFMFQRLSALVSSLPVQIQIQKIHFHHQVFQVSGFSEGIDGFHFFCQKLSQSDLLKTFQIRHWQEASQLKLGAFRFVMVWR